MAACPDRQLIQIKAFPENGPAAAPALPLPLASRLVGDAEASGKLENRARMRALAACAP
jgi:hypothetical protein